jgi:hypothetical protein
VSARPPRPIPIDHRTLGVTACLAAIVLPGCSGNGGDGDEVNFVQREGSRLVKVQSVGLAAFGPINPHTALSQHAEAAFGDPASIARQAGRCRYAWPALGLEIDFADPGGDDPCGGEARIEIIRVTGAAGAKAGWRTAEGIRPGMSVAAARRIYPEATLEPSGRLVLVERLAASGSPAPGPVLIATTARGRIRGLVFPIAAAAR